MTPLDRLVLLTYLWCVGCASDGNVSNFMRPAARVASIGFPASYAKFKPPLHSSGPK
jgi:hypothetical protein